MNQNERNNLVYTAFENTTGFEAPGKEGHSKEASIAFHSFMDNFFSDYFDTHRDMLDTLKRVKLFTEDMHMQSTLKTIEQSRHLHFDVEKLILKVETLLSGRGEAK